MRPDFKVPQTKLTEVITALSDSMGGIQGSFNAARLIGLNPLASAKVGADQLLRECHQSILSENLTSLQSVPFELSDTLASCTIQRAEPTTQHLLKLMNGKH